MEAGHARNLQQGGPAGTGSKLKLVANNWVLALTSATSMGVAFIVSTTSFMFMAHAITE